jgi:hypothetical protein
MNHNILTHNCNKKKVTMSIQSTLLGIAGKEVIKQGGNLISDLQQTWQNNGMTKDPNIKYELKNVAGKDENLDQNQIKLKACECTKCQPNSVFSKMAGRGGDNVCYMQPSLELEAMYKSSDPNCLRINSFGQVESVPIFQEANGMSWDTMIKNYESSYFRTCELGNNKEFINKEGQDVALQKIQTDSQNHYVTAAVAGAGLYGLSQMYGRQCNWYDNQPGLTKIDAINGCNSEWKCKWVEKDINEMKFYNEAEKDAWIDNHPYSGMCKIDVDKYNSSLVNRTINDTTQELQKNITKQFQ